MYKHNTSKWYDCQPAPAEEKEKWICCECFYDVENHFIYAWSKDQMINNPIIPKIVSAV